MPRSQNAHAIVHAGFLYKLSSDNIVLEARITYGGLSPCFIRAKATEKFLIGKPLFCNTTLQAALSILESELVVVENPPNPSAKNRKQLALSLFFKVIILCLLLHILRSKMHECVLYSLRLCIFSGSSITLPKGSSQFKICFWFHEDSRYSTVIRRHTDFSNKSITLAIESTYN